MNEIPDNELDDLFKKSAEGVDFPFDPKDWQRMEKKMDDNRPSGTNHWLRQSLLGALLLLLLGLGIYLWEPGQSSNESRSGGARVKDTTLLTTRPRPETDVTANRPVIAPLNNQPDVGNKANMTTANDQPVDKQNPDTEIVRNKQTEKPDSGKRSLIESDQGRHPVAMGVKTGTAERSDGKKALPSDASHHVTTDKKLRRFLSGNSRSEAKPRQQSPALRIASSSIPESQVGLGVIRPHGSGDETANNSVDKTGRLDKSGKIVSVDNEKPTASRAIKKASVRKSPIGNLITAREQSQLPFEQLAGRPLQVGPVRQILPVVTMPEAQPIPLIRPPASRRPLPLGIRLVLAPDLTTVGFRNFVQPGSNVGLLLEYHLTDRFLISAGGIYSRKLYKVSGDDYSLPYSYSPNYPPVRLVDVAGDCHIIDIPLNLRYDVLIRSRNRWFASAGVSSYLMKREDYNYSYYPCDGNDPYCDQLKKNSASIRNSNNHLFAVSNISIGYEHAVNNHFAWQVEPYFKIPLGGVGFGKIRLVSSGVFFSIKYNPFTQR